MILRALVLSLLAVLPLSAQHFTGAVVREVEAGGRKLSQVIASLPAGDAWVAWSVPTSAGSICCWEGDSCCGGCSISGRNISTGSSWRAGRTHQTSHMLLVTRLTAGKPGRISIFDAACPLAGDDGVIYLLRNVSTEASLDYLLTRADEGDERGAVFAIAMHESSRALPELIRLARTHANSKTRKDAIFWLGQKAGVKVAGELRQAVDADPDQEVRHHAVFAISQLPRERSVPMLIDLVRTHREASVRKRAMFWLAQSGDQRAVDLMEEILMR